MDGFNFTVFPSREKPCDYSCVDAFENWSSRIQAYFTKERELEPTEINRILAFILADFDKT